jgi:hypothetical protein
VSGANGGAALGRGPEVRLFAAMPGSDDCRSAYPSGRVMDALHEQARAQIMMHPHLRLAGAARVIRIGGDGLARGLPAPYGYLAIYQTVRR